MLGVAYRKCALIRFVHVETMPNIAKNKVRAYKNIESFDMKKFSSKNSNAGKQYICTTSKNERGETSLNCAVIQEKPVKVAGGKGKSFGGGDDCQDVTNPCGPENREWDYIVVGDGSTSNIVTGMLVRAGKSVLILERGKNNLGKDGVRQTQIDAIDTFAVVNPQLTNDLPWSVLSNAKLNLDTNGVMRTRNNYSEGNGWGGGGAHYYMNFWHGSAYFWDEVDSMCGATGKWSASALQPQMKAFETYTQRLDNPGPISPLRGTSGPFSVIQEDNWSAIVNEPILAYLANDPTIGVGYNPDSNDIYNPVGVSFRQMAADLPLGVNFGGSKRSHGHPIFLGVGEVINEAGDGINGYDVKIISHATADKVLFDGTKAIGVQYVRNVDTYKLNTILAASANFPFNGTQTLTAASTAGFATSGRLVVDEIHNVDYTGISGNTFTGCKTLANQTGTVNAGAKVALGLYSAGGASATGAYINSVQSDVVQVFGKRILLCSGALNDPAILQRSGVGNASLLNSLGIPVVVDNPNVGQNMTTHYNLGLTIANSQITTPSGAISYNTNLHGIVAPYAYPDDNVRRMQSFARNQNATTVQVAANMFRPLARGYTNITSKNLNALPDTFFNFLGDAGSNVFPPTNGSDLNRLMAWGKIWRKFSVDTGRVIPGAIGTALAGTDQQIADFIRNNINCQNHQAGTCRVGVSIADSVCNADLKVHGTKNLYCASLSVLPFAPDGNPQGSLHMVAVRLLQSLGIPLSPLPGPAP